MGDDITANEILEVIKQMPNDKSPGPDGFTGESYKRFSTLLVENIYETFATVTRQSSSLHPLNSSFLTKSLEFFLHNSDSKKEYAATSQDYRPVSLVHSIQIFFSKILENRLQQELHSLVDMAQTCFIKGRQISEGFTYAPQILHHSHKCKIPLAILKTDIHKALDTLSWDFLLKIMENLGFPPTWQNWIKYVVFSGSSQVIINGLAGKRIC